MNFNYSYELELSFSIWRAKRGERTTKDLIKRPEVKTRQARPPLMMVLEKMQITTPVSELRFRVSRASLKEGAAA